VDDKVRRDPAVFEEKRRKILRAASRVFAKKGYSGTRVGDIAREAGIAYGLVYHYFRNKEDVLNSLFQENWAIALKVMEDIHQQGGSLAEKLRGVASFFLEAWRMEPDLIEVLMIEVVRSPKSLETANLAAFHRSFDLIERIFADHAELGELREGVDPRMTGFLFLGSLEMLLTGFVARELLAEDAAAVASCSGALVDNFLLGVAQPSLAGAR